MAVYLGFSGEEYEERGGIRDYTASGPNLEAVQLATEATLRVAKHDAVEEHTISVAEQERALASGTMTSSGHIQPIYVKASPRSVECYGWAHIVSIETHAPLAVSVLSLVDDGDWNYHYERSEWSEVT